MKKRFSSADINQKHGNELSKKLYRTITDQTKRLDDARSCARNICDLFTPNLLIQRRKLCDYCERLIFSDPALYGRKGEELLWRKVFYDTVSAAKKLKKNVYTEDEISNLQNHIYAGIGFYHHMIAKLQTTFNLNLPSVIDFPIYDNDTIQNGELKEFNQEWAELAIHQCLIYLGDLNRYTLEILPNSETSLPVRFYMQAISYKPDYGMPHNQMGTLALSQDNHLDAVYYYMRCLACKYSFDGTSNNLISLFEKNSHYIEQLPQQNNDPGCTVLSRTGHIKRFLARFLLLIDIWYFNKNVPKVFNLCHLTFKDLDDCLSFSKSNSEGGETPTDVDSLESDFTNSPNYLNSRILFKITVICLLCISKLQSSNSQQVSTVTAFTLAVYSQLIQKITNHIQVSVLNYPLAEVDVNRKHKKKHLGKKMRRRKLKKDIHEDSESSDDDISVCSSDGSFISDEEDILAHSSEDEIDISDEVTTINESVKQTQENLMDTDEALVDSKQKVEVSKKVQKMDVNDMIEIISEENLLQSIKILNDWLMMDTSILKSCCTNTRSLIRQITHLLNLFNVNITEEHKLNEEIPLPEDVVLKGWDFLAGIQKKLDWKTISKKAFTIKEEAIIRILKMKAFGKHLMALPEAGITFDEKEKIYVCRADEKDQQQTGAAEMNNQNFKENAESPVLINGKTREESTPSPNNSRGGQLIKMKHMGQLWLASEVSALENRVRGKTSLSPYLVVDADALTKFNFMVKYLVQSRKFIVLVPTAVVSALDDLKREKPEARDAIRWLEFQFQRGNRFFRSQRPQEKASIPFIKYPKKKDKEMYNYIQIIECCYYLSEQQKGAPNVVTLLIGNQNLLTNGENKEFSYVGLAKTAGITIESITQFYTRWKKTNRDNR